MFVAEQLPDPVGIAIDPLTGDLLVLDGVEDRIVRIDPDTGELTTILSGFLFSQGVPHAGWTGIDITPDGSRIIVTDSGAGEIYTYVRSGSRQLR